MRVTIVLLVVFTLFGCHDTSSVSVTFDSVQCLMDENPDSALRLMQEINPSELKTKGQHARYALLYSQALDKNHIDVDSDSLIRVAVEYYKERDDVRCKFLSYYYHGRVYANARDLVKAMLAYMEAETLVDELDDDYYAGLLYTQMGLIFSDYYDFPKALDCHQRATEFYDRAGKPLHKYYSMISQGTTYWNSNKHEEGYKILCNVLAEARNTNTTQVICACLSDLLMLCVEIDRHDEAMAYYHELIRDYEIENRTAQFFAILALLMAKEKDIAMSDYYMGEAWKRSESSMDSVMMYGTSSRIEFLNSSYEKAYSDLKRCVSIQNARVREVLHQPIVTAQKDYLDMELENKNRILRMERYIRVLLIIIFLLTSGIVLFLMWKWFRRRYHRKFREKLAEWSSAHEQEMDKIQNEALEREQSLRSYMAELKTKSELSQQDIKRLTQELEDSREYIEHARVLLEQSEERIRQNIESQKADYAKYIICISTVLKRNFKQIEDISNNCHMRCEGHDACLKEVDVSIQNVISDFHGSRKADQNLEKLVNECYDNVMEHLRQEINLPSEGHYRLACQLLAGMSINLIALISAETPNAIYKRRDKIREIIKPIESQYKYIYELI